jgi:small-conductance mechanosensitive channel
MKAADTRLRRVVCWFPTRFFPISFRSTQNTAPAAKTADTVFRSIHDIMSKSKKKKKKKYIASPEEYASAKQSLHDAAQKFNGKLALLMLSIFAVLALLYYVLLAMHIFWVTPVLYTIAATLFVVFFFVNRGFSREPVSREILSTAMTEAEKDAFIENDILRKAIGRKIMVIMTPVLILVLVDMVILFFLPMLK